MAPLELELVDEDASVVGDGEGQQGRGDHLLLDDDHDAAVGLLDGTLLARDDGKVLVDVEAEVQGVGGHGAVAEPGVDTVGLEAVPAAQIGHLCEPG
jgi:hypothetical protein